MPISNKEIEHAKAISRRRKVEGMSRKDVEQEAYLALLQAEASGLPPALRMRAVRNHVKNLARRKPPDAPCLGHDPLDPLASNSVLTDVANREAFCLLLTGLTPREADLIRMIYEHDATDEELAEGLGYSSPRAVQRMRSKILVKLRRQSGEQTG